MGRRSGITQKKKRAAPATGKGTLIGLRLEPELLARVDRWAASHEERQLRKRRLLKGAREFQDLRRNRPKTNE
jgi:hypothetical protein